MSKIQSCRGTSVKDVCNEDSGHPNAEKVEGEERIEGKCGRAGRGSKIDHYLWTSFMCDP